MIRKLAGEGMGGGAVPPEKRERPATAEGERFQTEFEARVMRKLMEVGACTDRSEP